MSFSKQVKDELNAIQIKGNCCKKAYIFGALLSSERSEDIISIKISDTETAEKVIFLLKTIYKCEPNANLVKRGCFVSTEISFMSKKIAEFLDFADSFSDDSDMSFLFTCKNCESSLLRGAFCTYGSVNDPKKSYTLEMRVKNTKRALLLSKAIETVGISTPSIIQRDKAVGLLYRNESAIEDFITACGTNGAVNSLFEFYYSSLNKELINRENRATNCVASNISKTVEATELQISAIEALKSVKAYDDLPRELKISAQLRIDNPDMSLGELADLHVPHISKSGLNHRLAKIIEKAKKLKLI